MKQIVYRLKHLDGKFFNGFGNGARFTKHGKLYYSVGELKADINEQVKHKTRPVDVERWYSQVSIVKEEHEIMLLTPDLDLALLCESHQERARVVTALLLKREVLFSQMARDLMLLFPEWELNGFTHALTLHGYSINPNDPLKAARQVIKQVGIKRADYRLQGNTLALKSAATVAMIKLSLTDVNLRYVDLATL